MPQLQEIALWVYLFTYAIFIVFLLPPGTFVIWKDIRNKKKFSADVREKLNGGIDLNIELIRHISKARGLKEGAATTTLREILSDSRDKEKNQVFLTLCNEMDEIEPYSNLPAEVRISLLRLKDITKENGVLHSEDILQPIISNLSAHVNLKNDYLKSKKITILSFIFGFMSLIFGAWGIAISLSSPDINEIKSAVESTFKSVQNNSELNSK